MPPPRRTRARQRRRKQTRSPHTAIQLCSNSNSRASTSATPKLSTTLTHMPAEVLDLILLHLLDAPGLSRTLAARSFNNFDHALSLANTHSSLRNAFACLLDNLHISWNDVIGPHEVALIAASLRHLSITSHSLTPHYLEVLSASPPPLLSLSLDNVQVPPGALQNLIASNRLRSLSLSFITVPDLSLELTNAAVALPDLAHLELHGLSELDAATLLIVASRAGTSLHTLSLRYLRHPTLQAVALGRLPSLCPHVTRLALEDVRHAPPTAVISLVRAYVTKLSALYLHTTGTAQPELSEVLRAARVLNSLSIHEPSWQGPSLSVLAEGLCAAPLRKLTLRGMSALRDADLDAVLAATPKVVELTLRGLPGLTLHAVSAVAALQNVRALDLRGSYISDAALNRLTSSRFTGAPLLERLALGGDGFALSPLDAAVVAKRTLSNDGIDNILRVCGATLVDFLWETPRTMVGTAGHMTLVPVGVANLHARDLAESLALFCPKLRRVEVNWLCPPPAQERERGLCHLAFMKLDDICRHALVVVDGEPI